MFKSEKKQRKIKRSFSKVVAIFLAILMGISCFLGILPADFNVASAKTVQAVELNTPMLRNFIDTDLRTQSHYMMTGDNFLLLNYWMNASIKSSTGTQDESFDVTLQFTIPGYNNCCSDYRNLLFYIFDKNVNSPNEIKEYRLSTSTSDPTPKIYLANLKASNYEVHVYHDSLNENNFVAKSEFCCCPSSVTSLEYSFSVNLLDASGAPITDNRGVAYKVIYETPSRIGSNQFSIYLPKTTGILPYDSHTIKVVFFATNRSDGNNPNIDKSLYDYIFDGYNLYDELVFQFCPDAQAGIDPNTSYEAHFYRDSVLPGNFICKAVGIVNNQ